MTTATIPLINLRFLFIGLTMLIAAALAVALTPKAMVAADRPKVDLESLFPQQFGEWRVDESIVPVQVSPEVKAKLDKIYNQTLSRTYTNNSGERVMLSIAYGSDQSDSMAVHKPEVCYPAQGFQILNIRTASVAINSQVIPVKQVLAQQGKRTEPITYWITVGEQTVTGGLDRKIAQLRYGLTGGVPDGMLVRVSNISGPDTETAYRLHTAFINQLFLSVDVPSRKRIFGISSASERI